MSPWRWSDLNLREKKICIRYCADGMKIQALCSEFGISRTRLNWVIASTYRLIGVRDRTELAFELGRHWTEIQDEVASWRS